MSKVVLVTGINGFTGRHMGRFLLSQNLTVVGVGRTSTPTLPDKRLIYETCDLCHPAQVSQLINRYQFHYIIHLAGESSVPKSWQEPAATLKANALSTLLLLESVRQQQQTCLKRILIVGSAQEYGTPLANGNGEFTEGSPVNPVNPYGSSKRIQTVVAQMYAQHYALPIVITRTFNLIGPEARNGVCAQIAHQVVEMERGLRSPGLFVGNVQVQRDFLDVRDAITAYWSLLRHDLLSSGEIFNVCRGSSLTIEALVNLFQKHANVEFDVQSDPALLRNTDELIIRGDNRKLCATTGWKPVYSLETSISDTLHNLRSREVTG